MAEGPYAGVRVLDFTQGVAGPMACGLLAQFGTDVVKVEPPTGDRMAAHPGYLAWNCNKRRIVLDLDDTASLNTARGLLAKADVAVFDAAPGELERLGLDGETLTGANPRLVHLWAPMFGTTGRWSDVPPAESLMQAVSAIAWAQSSWEDVPVHLITPQVAYGHAQAIAAAAGAALFERSRSGLGQAVVCSGVHGTAAVQSGGAIRAEGVMRIVGGRGSRGGSPNYRLYQCADGEWLFLATLFMPFFLEALEALDLVEILAEEGIDGEIANLQKAPGNQMAMERLEARFAERPRHEWLEILHAAGVPSGPVGERAAWFASEQVAANGMRVELQHPELGSVVVPGVSSKLSETPGEVRALMKDTRPEAIGWGPRERVAVPGKRRTDSPLAGIRVLDLGVVIAGPFGPTILANYGADVIKVEPLHGDSFRTAALGFAGWNRGKRSVVLDLKDPEALKTFYELVRTSDVVVDNYRLGVSERLKIDHATLSAINPRVITCSVLGYGKTGPLAPDPGFDPLLQALSGMMAAQGGDHEPVFHTLPVNDEASGLMAAFAVVTALNARERTGRGQHVWTSLANQSVLCQSGELTWYEGRPPAPVGYKDCAGTSAVEGLYACADGWIGMAATAPGQFEALCEALGEPGWRERWPRAVDEPRTGELAEAMAAKLAGMERETVLDALNRNGIPAVAAITRDEATEDSWLHANGFWEEYELAGFGTVAGVRSYAEFSRTPGGFRYPAPQLGEHTEEVLAGLQLSAEREAKPEAV
jgi:crotonobetainyl-CoA:carnitine CoA-transferase CaiB-like acyl-CoA transferase